MAIYHLHVKVIGRKSGSSAVASAAYRSALKNGSAGAAKEYIQDKLRSAVWLIRSIHQRQRTIYKVTESIVKFQRDFLDFGIGHKPVTPPILALMARRETHFLRAYSSDRDDTPIGLVALSSIDPVFRTATFWRASGDKSFASRGYSTLASSKLMTIAFRELGLQSVSTWAVEGNPSVRIITRIGFRPAGRLRQCHCIDGRPHDRLLFDLLASEHRELDQKQWRRFERSRREEAFEARPA